MKKTFEALLFPLVFDNLNLFWQLTELFAIIGWRIDERDTLAGFYQEFFDKRALRHFSSSNILQHFIPGFESKSFDLSQNYPNPFQSSTTIQFSVDRPSEVAQGIYSLSGQRVSLLFEGFVKQRLPRNDLGYRIYIWPGN